MLTITCEIERKARQPLGGMRYVLTPVAQQLALSKEGPGANLYRTYITVSNLILAQQHLRPVPLSKAEKGATEIAAQSDGSLYINVFVSDDQANEIFGDLEKALNVQHLFVSLTTGSDLRPADKNFFNGWLAGDRRSDNMVMWSDQMPEIGLVQRK